REVVVTAAGVDHMVVRQPSRHRHPERHRVIRRLPAGAVQGRGKAGTAAARLPDGAMDNERGGETLSLPALTSGTKRDGTHRWSPPPSSTDVSNSEVGTEEVCH